MSYYAKVVNRIVTRVIVAEPEFFTTFIDNSPGTWIQTSYNTRGNVHYGPDGQPDGGVALRGNYAGVGYTYDPAHDVFYPPRPSDATGVWRSWTISAETNWVWTPPSPCPTDGKQYTWDEATTSWILSE